MGKANQINKLQEIYSFPSNFFPFSSLIQDESSFGVGMGKQLQVSSVSCKSSRHQPIDLTPGFRVLGKFLSKMWLDCDASKYLQCSIAALVLWQRQTVGQSPFGGL